MSVSGKITEKEQELCKTMMAYWANFMRTGLVALCTVESHPIPSHSMLCSKMFNTVLYLLKSQSCISKPFRKHFSCVSCSILAYSHDPNINLKAIELNIEYRIFNTVALVDVQDVWTTWCLTVFGINMTVSSSYHTLTKRSYTYLLNLSLLCKTLSSTQ